MLRITPIADHDGVTLKVEGKLRIPWVDELRSACRQTGVPLDRMRLDLTNVTFLDSAGIDLLHVLIRGGVVISRRSNFVAELLRMELP